MYQQHYYVPKHSGTVSDCLLAFGAADTIARIVHHFTPDAQVVLMDNGGYYVVDAGVALQAEWVERIGFFEQIPFLSSGKEQVPQELGWIARRIGPPATMWLAQAAAFAAYSLALIGAGLRVLADEEDRWYWVTAGWLLLCSLLALRVSLARPEMFMAAWAIAAVIPRRPSGIAAWVLGGLLLGASYWLAPGL